MRDREVVASIVAGDPEGLAAAYDRYAPQLLGYCRSLLREPADADDAVQDTFVIAASRLKDLRDPDHLRPWLYTVARNSCLRKLKAEKVAAAIYPAPGVAESATEVGVRAELADLRALVRDASAGLTTRDREVLVLRLWQGMDPGEAASVLRVSRSYGNALFARACSHLEICIGVLLVARTGREECARLAALLQGWDGQLDILLRKRLSRHIDHCSTCSQRRRHELVPALLGLSAGAAIAGAAAADAARQAAHMPAALKGQVLTAASEHIAAPAGAAAHAAGTGAAGTGAAAPAGSGAAGSGGAGSGGAGSGAGGAESATPGKEAVTFGKDGLPQAAATGAGRVTRAQVTAAGAGVAAAAVIATAIAMTLSGAPHQGKLASGATSGLPGIPGTAGASSQGVTPHSSLRGATGPGSVPGPRTPGGKGSRSGAAAVPSVGVLGGGSPQPSAGSAPSSGSSSGSGNPGPGSSSSPGTPASSAPASSAPPSTRPPAPGTLSVSTRSIPLDLGGSSTLTLTAHGGPVTWSISVPHTVLGDLSVSRTSGTLAAGQSTTVKISVIGLVSLGTTLEVEPGGIPVTVVIGIG